MLAVTVGVASGSVAAIGELASIEWIKVFAFTLFGLSWLVAMVSGVRFLIGFAGGRYRNLEPKGWREQVW